MLTSTLSGDHLVRILDFGIAQSLRDSAGTQDELTMGTVCYMALLNLNALALNKGRMDVKTAIRNGGATAVIMKLDTGAGGPLIQNHPD